VIFIDLDHFKTVNDQHGHLVGSKLLWMIGDAIKGHLRMIDYAFRYGATNSWSFSRKPPRRMP